MPHEHSISTLPILLYARYYSNLSSKTRQNDSSTTHLQRHVNSAVQRRQEVSKRSPGQPSGAATGPTAPDCPRGLGGQEKNGTAESPPCKKAVGGNRDPTAKHRTSRQVCWVLGVHICISMFLRYFFGDYVRKSLTKHNIHI